MWLFRVSSVVINLKVEKNLIYGVNVTASSKIVTFNFKKYNIKWYLNSKRIATLIC